MHTKFYNNMKTALLLGLMTGLILLVGSFFGRPGVAHRADHGGRDELRRLFLQRQDRADDDAGPGGWAGP